MKMRSPATTLLFALLLAACGDQSVHLPPSSGRAPALLAGTVTGEAAAQGAMVSIAGYRHDYRIKVDGDEVTVTSKSDPSDVQRFTKVARIQFIDRQTSLDVDGVPGQVYRLYQAAFNRKPDLAGLAYWIDNAQTRHLTMETIAGAFLDSPESIALYGQAPTNARLVTAAYANVLHRAPEQAGFDWWLRTMDAGLSRQAMLFGFSESPENKAALLADVAEGIDYAPDEASPAGASLDTPPVAASTIMALLAASNIDVQPGVNGRPAGTWHWPGNPARHVPVYIPPPRNGAESDYADKVGNSVAQINTKLNGMLVLEAVHAIPTSGAYIHVAYDTSYVPAGAANPSTFCANVSTAPYSGNPIAPAWDNGIASSPVYVNLGNGYCNVTQDIVTHEFGHALGLSEHFEGFGANNTPPISPVFWDVLATLYGNPRSTPAGALIVKRR